MSNSGTFGTVPRESTADILVRQAKERYTENARHEGDDMLIVLGDIRGQLGRMQQENRQFHVGVGGGSNGLKEKAKQVAPVASVGIGGGFGLAQLLDLIKAALGG